MAQISVSDAAFEGFRITRENPLAVGLWAIFFLVSAMVGAAVLSGSSWPALIHQASTPGADPMVLQQLIAKDLPALLKPFLVVFAVQFLVQAFVQTAVNRVVLRPGERAFGSIRLGLAELRTLLVLVAVFLLMVVIYFGGILLSVGLMAAAGVVGALAGVLILIGMIALMVWLSVRLSLAVSASFALGRIAFGPSLALTKGRFWPLFGAYLIALILFVLVLVLGGVISSGVHAAVGHAGEPAMAMTWAQQLTPVNIILEVVDAILSSLAYVILFAVSAGLYKHLTEGQPEQDV